MSEAGLSLVHGSPLAEEPGQGAQTIGGYLREVAARFGPAEALVQRVGPVREAWTYDELLARSVAVAKALIASGMGRDARVGMLMTNRLEFLSSLFGTALAGGVPVALSTFSTTGELDYLLKASQVSLLIHEARVLKKDFGAMLRELEPDLARAPVGGLASGRYPYLRHLVSLGGVPGGDDGFARSHGDEGIREFTRVKSTDEQAFSIPMNMMSFRQPKDMSKKLRGMIKQLYGDGVVARATDAWRKFRG